jgi:hypothetical protein
MNCWGCGDSCGTGSYLFGGYGSRVRGIGVAIVATVMATVMVDRDDDEHGCNNNVEMKPKDENVAAGQCVTRRRGGSATSWATS